jgi:hypothetical protein
MESSRLGKIGQLSKEFQFPFGESLAQQGQQFPTEQPAQDPHGQKELRAAGDPSRPVGRQATGRHDTVDMGMM